MNIAGIICEYNPMHTGHVRQIEMTREALGGAGIVCVMSGDFVQRGEAAVFARHARAEAAVRCGADLVVELPLPYCLSSAEGFARGGVGLLEAMGICTHISFGSESGDIGALEALAGALLSPRAGALIREAMRTGSPYAAAVQGAAGRLAGEAAEALKAPNNLLGIEYIKALRGLGSTITPLTIPRTGAKHGAACGASSSAIRALLAAGEVSPENVPEAAGAVYRREMELGRGPVLPGDLELAALSRLRMLRAGDFSSLPGGGEGLGDRLRRYARTEPTAGLVVEKTKTKRYAYSRLRRLLLCAVLGVRAGDAAGPPPYIRVLAMNTAGRGLLRKISQTSRLPVITKPASALRLGPGARSLFALEAAAADFYALAYRDPALRAGGMMWRTGPAVVE